MTVKIGTLEIPPMPVANNDTATTDFDSTVSIPVLDNDTGSFITIQSIDSSSTAGAVNRLGSNIIYDPNGVFDTLSPGSTDTDSFNYTIVDSLERTSTAAVNITVSKGLPAAPVANNDLATTDYNSTVSIPVLNNDTGNSISIQSIDTSSTQGTATQSGSDIVYDPNGQFDGSPFGTTDSDSFSYTIVDSLNQTSTATVNVNVNRQPDVKPVANDDTATVNNNSTVTISVLNNDTGNSISIKSIDTSSTQGTANKSGSNIIYNPNGAFNSLAEGSTGTDSFSYTVVDQFGQTDTATVTVTIENPPSAALTGSLFVQVQDASPWDIAWSNDGTRFFVTESFKENILQYNLSTPFDLNTASFAKDSFIKPQSTTASGLAFTDDGNSFFITNLFDPEINEYDNSLPFDIVSADYALRNFNLSNEANSPRGLKFNDDGTLMFVIDPNPKRIIQYNLSPGFDIQSATFSGNSFEVSKQIKNPLGFTFGASGTRMFVSGQDYVNSTVWQYNLGTAYDITTAFYSGLSFNIQSTDRSILGVEFNNAGTRIYIVGSEFQSIYQYDLATPFSLP